MGRPTVHRCVYVPCQTLIHILRPNLTIPQEAINENPNSRLNLTRAIVLYLQVVVHPRAHELSERVVRPLSDPAVNRHALGPEANGLRLELPLLEEHRRGLSSESSDH